ncbi:DUF1648 domain-containing protein [Marinilongibacter aquaticus]|uniref:DUF1648 domain-containing protein n=1 Tax=Marinilongibacter aquaticus TaxID=2975157 RepID=UPI0021BD6F16|nr:DUF1648 domain-containing protein [Marinilongibacter aquaticus]UBM59880.1 DUF1648 domain-containing protein [Marinilongibacter aquaticus]
MFESNKEQLKPHPNKTKTFDRILDLLAAVGLIALLAYPIGFYPQLPDQIPVHFNFRGAVDALGPKSFIWFIPAIGGLLFLLLNLLNRYPEKINYPPKWRKSETESQYNLARRMLRILKVLIIHILLYLNLHIIQLALDQPNSLHVYTVSILLCLLGCTLFYFLERNRKQ